MNRTPISRFARSRETGRWLAALLLAALHSGTEPHVAAREPSVYTSWKTYRSGADGLPDDRIRSLRVDGNRIWVGTMSGVASYTEGQWKTWAEHHGAPRTPVRAIDIDPKTGDAWLGTWGDGLYRFSGGRFDRFDQINSGLAGNLILSTVWFEDAVWAATNGGLSVYHPVRDEWRVFNPRRGDTPVPVVTSLGADGRNLLAITRRNEVLQWEAGPGQWNALTIALSGPASVSADFTGRSAGPMSMAIGPTGVWLAGRDTVLRRDLTGLWSRYASVSNGETHEAPPTLCAENAGVLAVGTDRGLSTFSVADADRWLDYTGHTESAAGCVTLNRTGALPRSVRLSSSPPVGPIRCVAFAGDDLWVGTDAGLFHGMNPISWGLLETTASPCDAPSASARVPRANADPLDARFGSLAHGRDAAAPQPAAIGIGVIGPRNRTIALPGEPSAPGRPTDRPELAAVQMAVERANADRGGNASPFEVIIRPIGYANYGWGTKEDDFAALAADQHIAGLLTHFDPRDDTTNAVIDVTETPVVNVPGGNGSERERETDLPWLFTCRGDEPRRHRMLIDDLLDRRGLRSVAVVVTSDPTGRRHASWWRQHLAARGRPLAADLVLRPGGAGPSESVAAVRDASPDVVLTSFDARIAAAFLRSLRAGGVKALVVGGPELRETGIAESLAAEAGSLLVLLEPRETGSRDALAGLRASDTTRKLMIPPDATSTLHARRSYDAAGHLIAAVCAAGGNRVGVQAALRAMSLSAKGEDHYERSDPPSPVTIASFVNGGWVEETILPSR